jgi:hypothetical protein
MEALLEKLANYGKTYPKEQHIVDNFISFVTKNPERCVLRENLVGHLTASSFVLSLDKSKVLLTHHKKLNLWLQLGGHTDGDIDVLGVAIKESIEESGIDDFEVLLDGEIFDIGIRDVPEHKGVPQHVHYDIVFLLQVKSSEKFVISEESNDLKWADVRSLTGVQESLIQMKEKYLGLFKI